MTVGEKELHFLMKSANVESVRNLFVKRNLLVIWEDLLMKIISKCIAYMSAVMGSRVYYQIVTPPRTESGFDEDAGRNQFGN